MVDAQTKLFHTRLTSSLLIYTIFFHFDLAEFLLKTGCYVCVCALLHFSITESIEKVANDDQLDLYPGSKW